MWTASDGASICSQSTRDGPGGPEVTAIHDPDTVGTVFDRTWLESPCAIQSPSVQGPIADTGASSPRFQMNTLKKYQCPMCFLDRHLVEFGRKSDFKKHLNNFHGTDVVWICRTKACHLSFATERAYSGHAKEAHKMEALPSSAARSELCPQLVFACGFADCKDRIFEASSRDDAPNSRDKYFEHIAKHFEDEFDVNDWEYRIQLQNLMRQQRVKSTWKTSIWPKERRTQLSWKPRSSGDLRRMLESRHLGDDISKVVRLAYILGTAPFSSSRIPPPGDIDLHFQLPFRSQCLMEDASAKSVSDDGTTATITGPKSRPQSMFRLPSRKGTRQSRTRPTTPASSVGVTPPMSTQSDTPMGGSDLTSGPHPGTPIPIPQEKLPADAPKFAPEAAPPLPRQVHTPDNEIPMSGTTIHGTTVAASPAMYTMPMGQQHDEHTGYHMYSGPPPTSMPDGIVMSPYEAPMGHHHDQPAGSEYGEMMYGCTPTSQSTVRPATPIPNKRPASWSRVASMEDLRPAKRPSTPYDGSHYDSPMAITNPHHHHHHDMPAAMTIALDQIPNAYGEMIPPHTQHAHHPQHHHQAPTSVPTPEWALPMRMTHEPQGGYHGHPQGYAQEGPGMSPMMTFFDDTEGRI